jgi:DNA-directed RNA polymerase subunit RPC12/RpoP
VNNKIGAIKMADEQTTPQETRSFPCPSCRGSMAFDPDAQALKCEYCSHKIDIAREQGGIQEYDFETADDTKPQNWGIEKRVVKCQNCTAETVLDATDATKRCAFCGSPNILENDKSAGLPPESLVPFNISPKKATDIFLGWVSKRFFAPNQLKTSHQLQTITGIYVPCWIYAVDTDSKYTAEAGTYYYEDVTRAVPENGQPKTGAEKVQKIRWAPVSGDHSESFHDLIVNASRQINEELRGRLEPFALNYLVRYQPEFLAGFQAERYSIGLKEGWEINKKVVDNLLIKSIKEEIHADQVKNLNVHTDYRNIKFKHVLLPVWVATYTYQNKLYQFMINGQSGKIQGKAPVSFAKVFVTSLLSLIGVLIIAALTGGFGLILLPVAAIIIAVAVSASCK